MQPPATKAKPAPISAPGAAKERGRLAVWLLAVMLVLVTMALYWPATGFDFINCDDPVFVSSNAHVQGGLNWEAVKWAFLLNTGDYWHPLTWLSLMLDASLFGQGAGGFHFTNVAFHAANGVLVFLLLRLLTGAFWRSVVAAALFALHPLRVESVAWVTERKDVLSAFFGLLALIFYARYARAESLKSKVQSLKSKAGREEAAGKMQSVERGVRTSESRSTQHAARYYALSLLFFACGLMSKAMLVTWPFVMLLLDYWPLQRFQVLSFRLTVSTLRPLVREKTPFFVLSGISCVLTYLTEWGRQGGAAFAEPSALLRLESVFVAYARYVGKIFWPVELALPYMNRGDWSWLEVAGSVLAVAGVCLAVLWLRWRWPYLLVGWCWFWGTLIPVIGLTKGWGAFVADRFTYMPSIGVLILTVWGAHDLTRRWRRQVVALSVAGSAVVVLCVALTRHQIGFWMDSEALFRHALEVTRDNYFAHANLGGELLRRGQIDEAIHHLQEAVRLRPLDTDYHINLGVALDQQGQTDEAIRQYEEAIRLEPDYADAHINLGNALVRKGQIDEAIRQYQGVIRLQPNQAEVHNNLGTALDAKGQIDEAIRQYQEAIRLKPGQAEAHNNLGNALGKKGQFDEAIRQFQKALRLRPDYADARKNLDAALATSSRSLEPQGASTNR